MPIAEEAGGGPWDTTKREGRKAPTRVASDFALARGERVQRNRKEDAPIGPVVEPRGQARMLDEILSATVEQLYIVDRQGRCVYANQVAVKALGLKTGALVGTTWHDAGVPASTIATMERERMEVFGSGQPIASRMTYPGADGVREYQYVVSPLHGSDGTVQAVVVTGQDVTVRERAERERQEALDTERKARLVAESHTTRLLRLQVVTEKLLTAVTAHDVADVIVTEGSAALSASAAAVVVISEDGKNLSVIGSMGYPPSVLARWQQLPLTSPLPLAEAVRTHQPVWIESPEERAKQYPSLADLLRLEDSASWAAVPLLIGNRAIGAFGVCFSRPNALDPFEKSFIQTLAHECARSLDRARLQEVERVALADAQRRREALETVLETAPIAIAVLVVPGHRITLANAQARALIGATRSEPGEQPGEKLPPEVELVLGPIVDRVYSTRRVERLTDLEVSFPGGRAVHMDATLAYVPGLTNRPAGVLILAQDVTQRVLAERQQARLLIRERALADIAQALVREVELPRVIDVVMNLTMNLLNASVAGVWLADSARRELTLVDSRGKLPLVQELLRTISYDAPSLTARAAKTGEPQVVEDVAAIPKELTIARQVAEEQQVKSALSIPLRSRGQLIGVVTYASPIRRHFSKSDLDFNLTIADLFAVAIENAQLLQKVRQALRLREEFMAAAAHELRTPITVIKGRTQWLLRSVTKDSASREALEAIVRHVDRMIRILDDLLSVIRVRPGGVSLQRERFDLAALTRDLATRTANTTRDHQFKVEAPDPLTVDADRELTDEVISRLLENAIRYSPKLGEIEVTARPSDNEGVVSVRDHGVGITRDRQPYVFEPFYELVPAGEPGYLGIVPLGLYLSKQIVEAHGGRIWFESTPGQGSTFSFSLPLAK